MEYDKFGVPILKDSEVENLAYNFLLHYSKEYFEYVKKCPIGNIFQYLREKYKVEIVFANLGHIGAKKVRGKVILSENKIFIDENLIKDIRLERLFLFTGAHEIAHWLLHRDKQIKFDEQDGIIDSIVDCEKDFLGKKKLRTPRDWIEHQANVFAGSLLMPKEQFRDVVLNKQMEMGIARNIGKIYLDRQKFNEDDFLEIVAYLQKIFGVSHQSIIVRLKALDILIEDNSRDLQHISKIFRSLQGRKI